MEWQPIRNVRKPIPEPVGKLSGTSSTRSPCSRRRRPRFLSGSSRGADIGAMDFPASLSRCTAGASSFRLRASQSPAYFREANRTTRQPEIRITTRFATARPVSMHLATKHLATKHLAARHSAATRPARIARRGSTGTPRDLARMPLACSPGINTADARPPLPSKPPAPMPHRPPGEMIAKRNNRRPSASVRSERIAIADLSRNG